MVDARTAGYGIFVLRVTLGVAALAHGLLKVFVFGPAGTVGFFGSMGFPAALAWYVMAAEVLGGIALIVGFHARIAALVQIPVLLGAASVHWANGWMFASPNGGWEFPVFWAAALVALVLTGPGAFALRDVGGTPMLRPQTA